VENTAVGGKHYSPGMSRKFVFVPWERYEALLSLQKKVTDPNGAVESTAGSESNGSNSKCAIVAAVKEPVTESDIEIISVDSAKHLQQQTAETEKKGDQQPDDALSHSEGGAAVTEQADTTTTRAPSLEEEEELSGSGAVKSSQDGTGGAKGNKEENSEKDLRIPPGLRTNGWLTWA